MSHAFENWLMSGRYDFLVIFHFNGSYQSSYSPTFDLLWLILDKQYSYWLPIYLTLRHTMLYTPLPQIVEAQGPLGHNGLAAPP